MIKDSDIFRNSIIQRIEDEELKREIDKLLKRNDKDKKEANASSIPKDTPNSDINVKSKLTLDDKEKELMNSIVTNLSLEDLIEIKLENLMNQLGVLPRGLQLFDSLSRVFQIQLSKIVVRKSKSLYEASMILGVDEEVLEKFLKIEEN